MRVARLEIKNFRGIKSACLDFAGHTLLLGMNNVGKSTVCEALELVLGPERLSKFPPVEEFDFYNARYLEGDGETSIPIEVDVTLTELSEEVAKKCAPHAHRWHLEKKDVLAQGEADVVDDPRVCECLRLKTIASYNREEDEFEAQTFFVDGPPNSEGGLAGVPRNIKRLFGFLYLRALRTGSRALSLERGSLLDIILKQRDIRTGIWETTIKRLRELDPPIHEGAADLGPVLENIERRLGQYIHLETDGPATQLFVSQLTREHLRKTISFFLRTSAGQDPVPFQEVGTGTLNTLVLALLTFIAEIKKDNVIFAMEEPEIALPPHTQRRIANYLLQNTTQCLVTSHSPYLIERFDPAQIQILRKDGDGTLTAICLPGSSVLKGKTYRRHARRGLAEGMLGRGVIVCEGVTEKDTLLATAEKMEESDPDGFYPLDLSGVTLISTDGDGSMPEFGAFFKALHVQVFALYDAKKRKAEDEEKFKQNFDIPCQTAYSGTEKLLVEEIPVARLWDFLLDLRDSGEKPTLVLPSAMPAANEVKALAYFVLEKEKGSGYAGRLIDFCEFAELPATILGFLKSIYALFPKPAPIPPIEAPGEESTKPTPPAAGAIRCPWRGWNVTLLLDERHKAILEATGHGLVLGGPGSGKTTLALLKAVDRIDKGLRPGEGILFLSFSRAAVARIADAVKNKVPTGKRSVLSMQTFHSFFWGILQTHGHLLRAPKRLSIVLAHDERAMREGIERADPGWTEWEEVRLRLFREEGRVCFDLFAPLTAELLARAKRIRDRVASRYPLILVDEAQDTGEEQWSCIKALSVNSQVICLADLDQLIFDHLPGVGPERVDQIRASLQPIEVDLGDDNNRSPGTEIVTFARDVLHGRIRGAKYKSVSQLRFRANAKYRDKAIRQSIGIISKAIRDSTGNTAESIGLIASYGSGVAIISAALRQDKTIPHQVLFDEAFVMLASRIGAFLLEPKDTRQRHEDVATFLDLLSAAYKAKGGKTALQSAKRFAAWADKARSGRLPSVNLVIAIDKLLQTTTEIGHAGSPHGDWTQIKRALRAAGDLTLISVAEALDYLVAFNRGQRIAANLSELWLAYGCYAGARGALDNALAQEQLLSGTDELRGIHVMNMHKCKGKQFDGIVLYRERYSSPFVWKDDPAPYPKSRKVLHVAINSCQVARIGSQRCILAMSDHRST